MQHNQETERLHPMERGFHHRRRESRTSLSPSSLMSFLCISFPFSFLSPFFPSFLSIFPSLSYPSPFFLQELSFPSIFSRIFIPNFRLSFSFPIFLTKFGHFSFGHFLSPFFNRRIVSDDDCLALYFVSHLVC